MLIFFFCFKGVGPEDLEEEEVPAAVVTVNDREGELVL